MEREGKTAKSGVSSFVPTVQYLFCEGELPLVHVLLEVVHGGLEPLSLGLLQREHHLPCARAPLRLLHLFSQLVLLRFSGLRGFFKRHCRCATSSRDAYIVLRVIDVSRCLSKAVPFIVF